MTSNFCSSIQTVPYMAFGMTSSTRGHLLRTPLPQIGCSKPPLLDLVVGATSSSSSLILKECCMAFTEIGFTKEVRQQQVMTTGLDPPHWWDQVDGQSSSFSSSIHRESYTASKTASFTRGVPPEFASDNGLGSATLSLALAAGMGFSFFSSWLMVTCAAFTTASSSNDQPQLMEVTTGWAPRR